MIFKVCRYIFTVISPWKRAWPFVWTNIISHPKYALCQVWLKLALWYLRRFLKLVNVFSLFPYYLPLEMGGVLHLNLNPHNPRMLWAKFGWNWPCDSWKHNFFSLSMYFRYFVIISPWKRAWPFIRRNVSPHHPSMLCAKFG